MPNDLFLSLIFTTNLLNENIKYNPKEILDVKWFSYEEILLMKDELRSSDLIINAIKNSREKLIIPLEIIKQLN